MPCPNFSVLPAKPYCQQISAIRNQDGISVLSAYDCILHRSLTHVFPASYLVWQQEKSLAFFVHRQLLTQIRWTRLISPCLKTVVLRRFLIMETTCENMLFHQQSIVNLTLLKMLTPSYKQIITCIYYSFKVIIIIILYFCAIYINKLIYSVKS